MALVVGEGNALMEESVEEKRTRKRVEHKKRKD